MLLKKLIEGMEEFLLGGFLTGNKLDIIDEEQISFPVFAPELDVFTGLDGSDQLVGELVALDIDDVGIRLFLPDPVGDGVQQMGLAHAGRSVDEQGIINIAGIVGNGNGGTVGKPVGRTYHEILKGELGIEVHGGHVLFILVPVGVQLLVVKYHQLGIGLEYLLQCIANGAGSPVPDHIPAKIRRGIDDQLLLGQLHHLGIVEPCLHRDGTQKLLQINEDLCPYIIRRIHAKNGSFPLFFTAENAGKFR